MNNGLYNGTGQALSPWGNTKPLQQRSASTPGAATMDFTRDEVVLLTATAPFELKVANPIPLGKPLWMLVKLSCPAALAITSSGINWVKPDRTTTTTFSQSGYTLTGADQILLYTLGDGPVYAKLG